jgi:hypothetical protein
MRIPFNKYSTGIQKVSKNGTIQKISSELHNNKVMQYV